MTGRVVSFLVGMGKEMVGIDSLIAGIVIVGAAFAVLADERDSICRKGYTASIRPPLSYTESVKRQLCNQQVMLGGSFEACMKNNELNHIVPLCLGGDPRDPRNLELQPWLVAKASDKREAEVCRAYCAGKMSLQSARNVFRRP